MIPWPWLIVAFYTGLAAGVYLIGLLQANGRHPLEDEEQMKYLARQNPQGYINASSGAPAQGHHDRYTNATEPLDPYGADW